MARADETKDGFFKRRDEQTGKLRRFWWTTLEGRRVSTGCRELEAARAWRREREREAVDPRYRASRSTTLEVAVGRFLTELEVARRAPKTIEYYAEKLGTFLGHWGSETMLSTITPARVLDFVAWRTTDVVRTDGLVERAAAPSTARKEVASLLTMLRSARHRGDYAGDPNDLKPLRLEGGYVPRERHPTREQFAAIVQELERRRLHHRAAWIVAAVATGGRLGEINRLRRAAIDLEARRYTLDVTKTKRTEGATRTRTILAGTESLFEYVLEHGGGTEPLALVPWADANLLQTLARTCDAIGVPRYSANDFRRALGTWLTEDGVPLEHVSFTLGHANVQTTKRSYAKPRHEAVGRLIDQARAGTESVPATAGTGRLEPSESLLPRGKTGAKPRETVESDGGAGGAEGLLIPLIVVRIHAPQPSGSQSESIEPVPNLYQDPDLASVAGLVLRKAVRPATEGDAEGVEAALAAAALALGDPFGETGS